MNYRLEKRITIILSVLLLVCSIIVSVMIATARELPTISSIPIGNDRIKYYEVGVITGTISLEENVTYYGINRIVDLAEHQGVLGKYEFHLIIHNKTGEVTRDFIRLPSVYGIVNLIKTIN